MVFYLIYFLVNVVKLGKLYKKTPCISMECAYSHCCSIKKWGKNMGDCFIIAIILTFFQFKV